MSKPTDPAAAPPAPLKVRVVLVRPHTHAGVQYPPGAALEVAPDLAAWLAEHGAIDPQQTPEG